MPLVGKGHKIPDGAQNFFANSPGCKHIPFCNEIPNVLEVLRRFRVKLKALWSIHCGERFSNSSSRLRRLSKNASPSIGLTLPLLTSS